MCKNASDAGEEEEWELSSIAKGAQDGMARWESIVNRELEQSEHMHIPDLAFSLPDIYIPKGFPDGLVSKESACNAGDTGVKGLSSRSGRSPGGGHGSPLQYSCLENPMDKGAWWATVHGVEKSGTRLSD